MIIQNLWSNFSHYPPIYTLSLALGPLDRPFFPLLFYPPAHPLLSLLLSLGTRGFFPAPKSRARQRAAGLDGRRTASNGAEPGRHPQATAHPWVAADPQEMA